MFDATGFAFQYFETGLSGKGRHFCKKHDAPPHTRALRMNAVTFDQIIEHVRASCGRAIPAAAHPWGGTMIFIGQSLQGEVLDAECSVRRRQATSPAELDSSSPCAGTLLD
ncbi:MAG: hypothetical protein IPH54_20665 [Rhodoferax sp.]|nr:hypothetical protein [Rhodoferax sp.]